MAADERGQLQSVLAEAMGRAEGNDMGPPDAAGQMGYANATPPNLANAATIAATSPFPNVQKAGDDIRSRWATQMTVGSGGADDASKVRAGQTGDPRDFTPKPEDRFSPVGNVAPPGIRPVIGQTNERTGRVHFGPPEPTTMINQAARADQGLVAKHYETLMDPKMRETAVRSSDTLSAAASALNLLSSANTGQLADLQTAAQKMAKWLNKEVDPKAPASETFTGLTVSLVGQIITQFGSGTGLSDADREFAKQAVGTLNKDPRAAQALLMETMRRAYKYTTNYNMMAGAGEGLAKDAGMNPDIFKSIVVPFRYSAVDPALGKWTELPPDQWPMADQVLLQQERQKATPPTQGPVRKRW
jgi:hypothetical protein